MAVLLERIEDVMLRKLRRNKPLAKRKPSLTAEKQKVYDAEVLRQRKEEAIRLDNLWKAKAQSDVIFAVKPHRRK